MKYTVFLDRDGVINIDSSDYIKDPSEFEFIPNSAKAIARLSSNGFRVILITNQSIIGRNMASRATLDAIFEKLVAGVQEQGGRIDDIFFCPHAPRENCTCRKPKPKMILDAAEKHGIDLSLSFMVGDSAKDVECALNAGCVTTILVQTGNGPKAQQDLSGKGIVPDAVVPDLSAAAEWIINSVNPDAV